MRVGSRPVTSSNYYNKEVALNELLLGGAGLATATLSSVSDSAASQTLLSANSERKGCVIYNDSTVILYVAFAATATTSAFTYRLAPTATLELFGEKNYTGVISGIWASDASGAARITEIEA